jgi:polyhydroxyalkanoate synthase subunit PhaC
MDRSCHLLGRPSKPMPPVEDVTYGLGLTGADPAALGGALAEAAWRVARRPGTLAQSVGELALDESAVALRLARGLLGADGEQALEGGAGDRRFSDRAWSANPFLRSAAESYLVASRWAERTLGAAGLPERKERKARFALRLLLDAAAPTNQLWLHPTVLKEAIDTGGLSVARGFANFLEDVVRNGGRPSQVDLGAFQVGETLAATPGRVVFRNDLIELIAYEPRTETVHAQPVLYSPPWVNKYYVMDLAPGRSFVEHAVGEGFTVFAISYRNPDESMADLRLDDYLRDGLLTALDQVCAISGSPSAHVLGVCLGGTLTAMALGVLAARGEADRIGSAALVNTLVDFSDPGDVAVFVDEDSIARIEERTRRRGYLKSSEMAATFTWMRGNDLVWSYVVSSWGLGKRPPAFDVLAWNADGTRLPAAMHSQFLRACYLENSLAHGDLELDGTRIDLSRVDTPLYVLGCERDHIAPWRTAYGTTQLVGGEPRFVLASSGHIAGMVSPPGSAKAYFRSREETPADPEEWLRGAERTDGSWWEDWSSWASARAGNRVAPPALPDGDPAPGRYVFG